MRLTQDVLNTLAFPKEAYFFHEEDVIKHGCDLVRELTDSDPSDILGLLSLLDVKLAIKRPQEDLYFKDFIPDDINLNDRTVRFEAALCIFTRLMLNNREDTVGITRSVKDGGFDIACRTADGRNLLMLDAKSGTYYGDNHVEWNHLDSENKALYRIVNLGSENLGSKANEAKRNKFVYNLSLKTYISNMLYMETQNCKSLAEIQETTDRLDYILRLINKNKSSAKR